jgi:hypothetical protein
MGDDSAMKPATSEEVRQLAASVHRTVDTLSTTVHSALSQRANTRIHPSPSPQSTLLVGGQMESINGPVFGEAQNSLVGSESTARCNSRFVASFESQNSRSVSPSSLPMAGVSIPSLGRAPGAWRRAVKQWMEVDPQTGLALRDWPSKWYTGLMRTTTGSLHGQRQIIFEEYERYVYALCPIPWQCPLMLHLAWVGMRISFLKYTPMLIEALPNSSKQFVRRHERPE